MAFSRLAAFRPLLARGGVLQSAAVAAAATTSCTTSSAATTNALAANRTDTQHQRSLWTTPVQLSDTLSSHRDSPVNNESTPFNFTRENAKRVKEIIAKYPRGYERSASIPLLDLAQRQHGGWLPLSAMQKVAKILNVPEMDIFEVATFYTMFRRDPVGKYLVEVCTTTPCELCGSTAVVKAAEKHLGIKVGETTPDGLFTLVEAECLGACVNAPMIQIGDHYYEDLTEESTVRLLEQLARGEEPKVGPQPDPKKPPRRTCEPWAGRTSLFSRPTPPPVRPDL